MVINKQWVKQRDIKVVLLVVIIIPLERTVARHKYQLINSKETIHLKMIERSQYIRGTSMQ